MTDYSMVKPTKYAGITFRSRLEARWAVFFDALGISWEYEPETFTRQEYGIPQYTPDFSIQLVGSPMFYVEVKPTTEAVLARRATFAYMVDFNGPCENGLVLLGPIPRQHRDTGPPMHPRLYWDSGVNVDWGSFCKCPGGARWARIEGDAYADNFFNHHRCTAPDLPRMIDISPDEYGSCVKIPLMDEIALVHAYNAARNERFGLGGMAQAATANDRPFWLGPQRPKGFSL